MDLMNLEPESRIRFVGHDRLGYIPEKGVFDLLAGKQRYKTHEWGNPVQSYEQRYLIDAHCVLDMATGERVPAALNGEKVLSASGRYFARHSQSEVLVFDVQRITKHLRSKLERTQPLSQDELETAWRGLSVDDKTIATLMKHPLQTLTLAKNELKPVTYDRKKTNRLLSQLRHDDINHRAQAFRELRKLHASAKNDVIEYLKSDADSESKRLAERVLETVSDQMNNP